MRLPGDLVIVFMKHFAKDAQASIRLTFKSLSFVLTVSLRRWCYIGMPGQHLDIVIPVSDRYLAFGCNG